MDYRELLESLKTDAVKSAQVAVDYLDNNLKKHLEVLMKKHLTDWDKRGFIPVYENPLRILIERSAKTYKESPSRTVHLNGAESEEQTAKYNELLDSTNLNFITQDLDARARLFKASVLLPQVDKESQVITLSVLARDNCAIEFNRFTGEIVGLCYASDIAGLNGGQLYTVWTKDYIYDLEDGAIQSKIANPYDIIPAAILYDTRPVHTKLWKSPAWEQLIQLSDGVNLFNTEALFNARYAMVGSPVTNMTIPEGTVRGVDAALELEGNRGGDTPFFEFASPTANVTEFMAWMKPFREAVADEWGVNLNIGGSGTAESGFKLVVEEFENIELRETRIISAKSFEKSLYKVFAAMSKVHDWGLNADGVAVVDFVEPRLPVNNAEEWIIDKEKLALGILSPEDYWLKQNPDLTDVQLAEKRKKYDQARGLAANVPAFGV